MPKKRTVDEETAASPPEKPHEETETSARSRVARLGAAAAKKLEGTRAQKLLKELPAWAEKELDSLLDRVGLVRKSRIPRPLEPTPPPSA